MEILDLSLLDPIDPPGCEEDNEAQEIRHGQKDSRIRWMRDRVSWPGGVKEALRRDLWP